MVPELVKKKTARNETLKVKAAELKAKKKAERKDKLKEWTARGERWYKEDQQSRKALITLKRQVLLLSQSLGQTYRLLLRPCRSEGGICGEDQGVRKAVKE